MAFFSRQNTARTTPQWSALSSRIHQLMQLHKYDRALESLESVLEESPQAYSDAELDMFYQCYGECLIQSGRPIEALKILSLGLNLDLKETSRCKETLEELAIPAVEKYIMTQGDSQDFLQISNILGTISVDSAQAAVNRFLALAGEAYRNRDYPKAAASYDIILPLAEKHGLVNFEDLLRAGDSSLKCSKLNKAWKLYKSAQPLADTYSKSCRLHKKIADLLVIRNQNWHGIYHYLVALQAVPGDRGARTKLQRTLTKLELEQHLDSFLRLISMHSAPKELEISVMDLRKTLKAN